MYVNMEKPAPLSSSGSGVDAGSSIDATAVLARAEGGEETIKRGKVLLRRDCAPTRTLHAGAARRSLLAVDGLAEHVALELAWPLRLLAAAAAAVPREELLPCGELLHGLLLQLLLHLAPHVLLRVLVVGRLVQRLPLGLRLHLRDRRQPRSLAHLQQQQQQRQ